MIRVDFSADMEKRFLDREIHRDISQKMKRFFATAGGSIMTTARRLLQKWAQKSLSEMTEDERARYKKQLEAWKVSRSFIKPRKPDKVAPPGQPPRLHSKKSPLKYRTLFAITEDQKSVVIGPEALGANKPIANGWRGGLTSVEQLEKSHPFMKPAFNRIIPRLPAYLAKTVK